MLVSNIIASKIISIGTLFVPVAVIIFPFAYIFSDIFNEIYGYRATRRTAWFAFSANLLMVLLFKLAIVIPGAPFYENQKAFEDILGGTWRILIASLVAYMVGDFINDVIFKKMKERHGEKKFSIRSIFSSMIGMGIDSFLFLVIAFFGMVPTKVLLVMIPTQWGVKITGQIIFFPLTLLIVKKIKKIYLEPAEYKLGILDKVFI
jgi:uncharacterized integral membrane protein (TIGR00697 family)